MAQLLTPLKQVRVNRKFLSLMIRLVVTAVLLVILGTSADLSKFWALLAEIDYSWIIAACAFLAAERVLVALRWQYTLILQGMRVSLMELTRILFVSMFFAHFLPGGLTSADVFRGYELVRSRGQVANVTATLILDRFAGFGAMLFLAVIGAIIDELFLHSSLGLVDEFVLVFFLLIGGWLFTGFLVNKINLASFFKGTRYEKIWAKLLFILISVTDLKKIRGVFWQLSILSLILQVMRCVTFYSLYRALGVDVAFTYFLVFIPVVFLSLMLPISFGGLGVREGTLVYMFRMLGIAPEVSIAVGILSHFLQVFISIPVVIKWVFANRHQPIIEDAPAPN